MLIQNAFPRMLRLMPFLVASLTAHDLYILPDAFILAPRSALQVAFHNGDSFPASETAPPLQRLRDAQLRSATRTVSLKDLKVDGKRVRGSIRLPADAGNLILSVHSIPKFISMPPDKFLSYLKEEGLTEVVDWRTKHGEQNKPSRERYSKFAKSLLLNSVPDGFYSQSMGFPIEIIPEANPYTLHAGGELPVRVMFQGKPAAALQVETAWADKGQTKTTVIGRTDAQGRIRVPLTAAGKWRLHSVYMEQCADRTVADWESYWASLTFEIPAR